MKIQHFFDDYTFSLTYIITDENTKECALIDPVLNYELEGSTISYDSVEQYAAYIKDNGLKLKYILETHAHADHISSSQAVKRIFPDAVVAINKNVTAVQELFKTVFAFDDFKTDGSQFDKLLNENEPLQLGELQIKTIFTPGHTPACSTFQINDCLFVGDAIFMPDFGTGRCDFPAGSASDLFESVSTKLYTQPDDTRVFVGHDYQPGGRKLKFETTIGESKKSNIALRDTTTCKEFTEFRKERDAELRPPKLIMQSVQINMDAGRMPCLKTATPCFLKIPVTLKK